MVVTAGAASSVAERNTAVAGQLGAGQDVVVLTSFDHSRCATDWGKSL